MSHRTAIPRWLKFAYTLWFGVWFVIYATRVGPANFLWLCDVGNIVLLLALWSESRALFSATAVGVVLVQSLWCVDLLGRLTLGFHPIGGTEYMFDPAEPVVVRALSLYHVWIPMVLLWAVHRLGFDRRAWKIETLIVWLILPLSFLQDPALNLNWLWRPFGIEQTLLPPALYMVLNLVLYPLVLFVPSQWLLTAWLRSRGRPIGP